MEEGSNKVERTYAKTLTEAGQKPARPESLRVPRTKEDFAGEIRELNTRAEEEARAFEQAEEELSEKLRKAEERIVVLEERNAQLERDVGVQLERILYKDKQLKTLSELEETDALTNLVNRRGFEKRVRSFVATFSAAKRAGDQRQFTADYNLLFLDIDHFKDFNTKYGHQGGDEVLKGVAKILEDVMRPGDLVGRWGGEEFLIGFMNQRTKAHGVTEGRAATAERVRKAVESAVFEYQGQPLKVTLSIGAAKVEAGESYESLVKRANLAMQKAKNDGRNRTVVAEWEEDLPRPEAEAEAS